MSAGVVLERRRPCHLIALGRVSRDRGKPLVDIREGRVEAWIRIDGPWPCHVRLSVRTDPGDQHYRRLCSLVGAVPDPAGVSLAGLLADAELLIAADPARARAVAVMAVAERELPQRARS